MNNNILIVGLIAVSIGFGGGYLVGGREPEIGSHVMPNGTIMDDSGMTMGGAMADMMAGLEGKTGDEFDKAFLSDMIVHHEGAVEMAQAALVDAKHDELKQMASAIISAQTEEIGQMKTWQKSWYNVEN